MTSSGQLSNAGGGSLVVGNTDVSLMYHHLLERIISNYKPQELRGRPFCLPWCNKDKALVELYRSLFKTALIRLPTQESIWSKAEVIAGFEPSRREHEVALYVTSLYLREPEGPYTPRGVFDVRKGKGRRR